MLKVKLMNLIGQKTRDLLTSFLKRMHVDWLKRDTCIAAGLAWNDGEYRSSLT